MTLEVLPFTRIVFYNKELKSIWKEKINRISRAHNAVEYQTVLKGYRKCATLHISPKNMESVLKRIAEDGLVWLPISKTGAYEGFSHKHLPPSGDWNYYGVLARSMEDALEFYNASVKGIKTDHTTIGKLLGYPECCINFFNEIWPNYYDPIFQAAERTNDHRYEETNFSKIIYIENPYPEANQTLRYVGIRITSHLPCSFKCEETKKIGKYWIKTMEEIDPEAMEWALEILSSPIVWDSYHGVVEVWTPYFIVISNTFPYMEKKRIVVLNSDKMPEFYKREY